MNVKMKCLSLYIKPHSEVINFSFLPSVRVKTLTEDIKVGHFESYRKRMTKEH